MPVDLSNFANTLARGIANYQQAQTEQQQLELLKQKQAQEQQGQTFGQNLDTKKLGLDTDYLNFQKQQAAQKQQRVQQQAQAAIADLTTRLQSATDPAEKADLVARIQFVANGGDPARALTGMRQPAAEKARPPSIDTEYEGDKGSRVGRDPTTGAVLWRSPAGTLKPSAEALKADREARMAAGIAQSIPELASKIDPNDTRKLASQAKLYSMSGNPIEYYAASKIMGPIDNNYANLFSQIGQLDAALTRAYTGGRISAQVYQRLHPHFPSPGDPPELLADKIKSLLGPTGVLQQEHDAISQLAGGEVGGPLPISPASGEGAPAGGGSSFSPGTSRPEALAPPSGAAVKTSPKGYRYYTDSSGSTIFLNPNSGRWEPLD